MKLRLIAIAFLSLIPAAVLAAKPTSEEAKKVLDFYFNGQGLGVVLADSKLCRDIEREGDQKNECAGELDSAITKGESVYVWMNFMVPNGEEKQNVIVQFENNNVTRMVKNIEVRGGLRFRTWRKVIFEKLGNWEIKIIHDKGDGTELLGTKTVVVE